MNNTLGWRTVTKTRTRVWEVWFNLGDNLEDSIKYFVSADNIIFNILSPQLHTRIKSSGGHRTSSALISAHIYSSHLVTTTRHAADDEFSDWQCHNLLTSGHPQPLSASFITDGEHQPLQSLVTSLISSTIYWVAACCQDRLQLNTMWQRSSGASHASAPFIFVITNNIWNM